MTDSCGYFVLYFLINRFYNKDLPFNDLLNEIFVASHEKNENLVQKFKEDHF